MLGGKTLLCPARRGPAVLVAPTPRGAQCLQTLPWGGERCPVVGLKKMAQMIHRSFAFPAGFQELHSVIMDRVIRGSARTRAAGGEPGSAGQHAAWLRDSPGPACGWGCWAAGLCGGRLCHRAPETQAHPSQELYWGRDSWKVRPYCVQKTVSTAPAGVMPYCVCDPLSEVPPCAQA